MSLGELRHVLEVFDLFVLGYFLVFTAANIGLCYLSFQAFQRHLRLAPLIHQGRLFRSGVAPAISVICPAYNERATIATSVHSLLSLDYPSFEVVVVNDGSTDDTLDEMRKAYAIESFPRAPTGELETRPVRGVYRSSIHRNLIVVDKENGGKADAMNAGVNFTRNPLVCVIDADSVLERDVLLQMVRPFLEDPHTVAAGGVIRIVNDSRVEQGQVTDLRLPRKHLVRFQVVEYFRAFLFGRVGWASLNALLIVSGAFGLFARRSVLEVGGFRARSLGEDMEIVMKLHRHYREKRIPYRIAFVPRPICWTEAPERIRGLARQRRRWQRGLMENLWWHRKMFLNPRYGAPGLLAYPFFLLFEFLGPIIESAGYVVTALGAIMGLIDPGFALFFLCSAVLLGVILSLSALLAEGLTARRYPRASTAAVLMAYGVLENLGYRQLHALWRLQGIWDQLRGTSGWEATERKGFATPGFGAGESPRPASSKAA